MRQAHWIKQNHQERMPPRMVAFDTEAISRYEGDKEIQEWRVGCAIRWRTDLVANDHREARVFCRPLDFWRWVSDYCRKGTRTVVWAHNLGYDVRTSDMFTILPQLGFHLEWCNLDRNISSATWRSDHGTIVLADAWTWIPMPLAVIAGQAGMVKYEMPGKQADSEEWASYCMRDAEILHKVVCCLVDFITTEGLGNWQPTGAGMAMATWRHKFMDHKILVHDNLDALTAERTAMHTGRAEAWRHGPINGEQWTEVDLKNAYVTIASQVDLPRKLHFHCGPVTQEQFQELHSRFAVLSRIRISSQLPTMPVRLDGKHVWPIGEFETWAWDVEVINAIRHGAEVRFLESYVYVRDPVLRDWGQWVLRILRAPADTVPAIVRTHVKHCSRALIGRLSLRTPAWEHYGVNVDGFTGITHAIFPEENRVTRMLHVGEDTLLETSREEGRDSLPMITGYIMAECRVRIWEAIHAAGYDNVAHVDTDSILCNKLGLARLADHYGNRFLEDWSIKGTYSSLAIYGPRQYYRDKQRVTSGIPVKAIDNHDGTYTGEQWSALASDLEAGLAGQVTIKPGTWHLRTSDPRRADAPGGHGRTRAYGFAELSSLNGSSAAETGSGA